MVAVTAVSADGLRDLAGDVQLPGLPAKLWPGTFSAVFRVVDETTGGAAHATQLVLVVDTQQPVITLLGTTPYTLEAGGVFCGDAAVCFSTYEDPGATAHDPDRGDVTGAIAMTSTVDLSRPGTYPVTFTVTDSANLTATALRTVNVRDTLPPTVALHGPALVEV